MRIAFKPKIDYLFLSLALFVAAINMPLFLNIVLPLHDTMNFFQNFYFFYNELYVNGELAQWAPYGYYGIQSDFFFICQVPPAYYLSGLLGYALRIENAYFLFKAALFFEQIVFLYGVYRLAGQTFKRKATVAFVCLASVGGTVLLVQSTFNFRMYYMLPLIIFFLVRFFSTYRPQYALYAALVGLISLLGGGPSNAAILLLQMAVVVPTLFIGSLSNARYIKAVIRRDIVHSLLLSAVLGGLTLAYHYYVTHMLDETAILAIGRDPVTGVTPLDNFLTYGQDIGWRKFLDLLSPYERLRKADTLIHTYAYDSSLYIGMIPLFFAGYGLLFARKFRNALYVSVLILIALLGLLSVGNGTPVAALLYKWFPMMEYYRHIGYVVSCYKFLIPILAGFGFEHLIEQVDSTERKNAILRVIAPAAIFLVSTLLLAGSLRHVLPAEVLKTSQVAYLIFIALVIAMGFFVRAKLSARSGVIALVVVFYIVELISYQALVNTKFATLASPLKPVKERVFRVEAYDYQPKRLFQLFPNDRSRDAWAIFSKTTRYPYAFAYNFMQWDSCTAPLTDAVRMDQLNANVQTLAHFALSADLALSTLGCNAPKIRLLAKPQVAEGDDEAGEILLGSSLAGDGVVLSDVPDDVLGEWNSSPHPIKALGRVGVNSFKANRLDLTVEVKDGPLWLYYADAWHSGWHATVNGKPQGISRANLGFKAVLVPEGESTVSFFFNREASYRAALAIIFIGTLVMAALLVSVLQQLLMRPEA